MVETTKSSAKMSKALFEESRKYANTIVEGLNASPSHFHAVNFCKERLRQAGFSELREIDKWP